MAALHLNQEGFDKLVAGGGTVLVDFWAGWCGPCKMLAPVIEELAAEYEGRVTVGKVDVDQEQALAMQFGIMSIPTVILLQNGQEVDRIVGLLPKGQFTRMIDAHI